MNKRKRKHLLPFAILISLMFLSCFEPESRIRSGVVITFDDRYVSNWVWADSVLSEYEWKATFCVSGPQVLNAAQFNDLRDLKAFGHEIAGHGVAHLNAVDYVSENGLAAYVDNEILPMISTMKDQDIEPLSFAYPYGTHSQEIDDTLLTYFKILRSTTYTWSAPEEQICYYENSPIVSGLGTDGAAGDSRTNYFLGLLEYARDNNKILIVYAHRPVAEVTGANQTDIRTLLSICNYIRMNNMRFYGLSELDEKEPSKIIHAEQDQ